MRLCVRLRIVELYIIAIVSLFVVVHAALLLHLFSPPRPPIIGPATIAVVRDRMFDQSPVNFHLVRRAGVRVCVANRAQSTKETQIEETQMQIVNWKMLRQYWETRARCQYQRSWARTRPNK